MLSWCVLTLLLAVAARGEEYEFKITERNWGFQSYLEVNFTIPCNESTLLTVQPFNYVEWETPGKHMITPNMAKYKLSHHDADSIFNMYLTIVDVHEEDAGVYVCHVYDNSSRQVKRGHLLRGLNIGGHKYREAFDEYRENLMVGGLAAVVLFVPLVTACFIYKFRYQTVEQRRAKHEARLEANKHQRHLEANGKGSELNDIVVSADGVQGETNRAYDNANEALDTKM